MLSIAPHRSPTLRDVARGLLCLGLMAALAAPAIADRGRAYAARGAWDAELAEVDALLRAGRWTKGLRATLKLKGDILDSTARASDAREVLAELALQHAIVYANTGDEASAAWYWYTASALDLKVHRRDFSAYGTAGALFDTLAPRALHRVPDSVDVWTDFGHPGFEMPRQKPLRLPKSLAGSLVDGRRTTFVLEFIVDRDGTLREPVLENDLHPPVVVFHYMDWIWRSGLPPARVDGEPVAVLYEMRRNLINDRWVETSRSFSGKPRIDFLRR
ncbi:MAG: hypothetical protein AAGC60_10160 [Acidobacteriota bacterium]